MNKKEKDIVLVEFGKRIQKLRKEKNISQEKLAELAGLHRTYIGMIERGEKNITLRNINRIANAINIDIKDLFNKDNNSKS
jgi:transcriptional regulator with XRE-family HTH domain